jgi:coenzyme F420-reducing hydrogenase delta subunit/ferredoxin
MCTGRIDMELVLEAFVRGADAVFIGGCRLGECNYTTNGNYHALNMALLVKRLIEHAGLNPDRLSIEFMSSGEGIRFAEVMNEFSERVREMGPLGRGEGLGEAEVTARLSDVIRLVPYIKLALDEKLGTRLLDPAQYDTFFTRDEIEHLLNDVVSYYIDPAKCQACGICARKCPVEAIAGGRNLVHIIDQSKCIKCETCFKSCPARFAAIRKIVREPVPPPIAEEARQIVRQR